jgi:hypothetical protein
VAQPITLEDGETEHNTFLIEVLRDEIITPLNDRSAWTASEYWKEISPYNPFIHPAPPLTR